MDIKEFFSKYPDVNIWESNIEEHNRYLKPPKGVDIYAWVVGLLRNKYEFFQHTNTFKSFFNKDK